MSSRTSREKPKSTSTELTGGAGFTYEDTIVAYYLSSLLREERAAGQSGTVVAVAVQQHSHGHPMDDVIVEFNDNGSQRRLSLQAKRQIRISASTSNKDFQEIISRALATRSADNFNAALDAYGFVTENVATAKFRSLNRLIDWAKSSPTGEDFAKRFAPDAASGAAERSLRCDLAPLINADSPDEEREFYSQFVALNLDTLTESGVLRTEVINRLRESIAANKDGQELLLFDRLCRIAREGAAGARKWTRQSLLAALRSSVRLKVAPHYVQDIDLLQSFSKDCLADVSEEIGSFRVERPTLEKSIRDHLAQFRLVNLSGLPGCGKSAMLKRIASSDSAVGPILFLKSDRLSGTSWLTFATALGLQHRKIADLLAEIGSTGTPILFVDGIDRVKPDQKGIIIDILRAIECSEHLSIWKVLTSSRDQGLEAFRAWIPASFYQGTGIGNVSITAFSDKEAEALAAHKPKLRQVLFGPEGVREIARRPFFAAVLAHSFPDSSDTPQTEVDLILTWWNRAGHDAPTDTVPQRQRALLDLAGKGVRSLGKNIPAKILNDHTHYQIAGLKVDLIVRDVDGGASYSFTHDIFFEWAFFRQLIELGNDWTRALIDTGEPPLLGRVVGLLAQNALNSPGKWSAGYRDLEVKPLRPQWRREWLTAPPFTPTFEQGAEEFRSHLAENDWALIEKLLVWFQAQHTVPTPLILRTSANVIEGIDRGQLADALSWPSDYESWGRLLDWLLPLAPRLPIRLLPNVIELFAVWQNLFAEFENPRSKVIVTLCANWLAELEEAAYPDKYQSVQGRWDALGGESSSSFASNLRIMIMRSARAYPATAISLFERAVRNERMRRKAYADLMGFASIMADVAPEIVASVAKAELLEELPLQRLQREDREYKERIDWRNNLRAIPEEDRTEEQKRALQAAFFPIRRDRIDFDDIGIDQHHNYYFPASPIHEPFVSLFAKKPNVALGLVRDLANHGVEGWHQIQLLNVAKAGTPIPVVLDFPWGTQEFWGDWRIYRWFMGEFAPNSLECAFLAVSYWAHKEIEAGRPVDEVIRAVVEGNKCYAVLGLALTLGLESYNVTETTLPIVTCQRLWHHDIARLAHEPARNIDILGLGYLSRLTGEKAKAKEFLDSRQSRKREVRELAMRFALAPNQDIRSRFKAALARFPDDLPYEIEEQRKNDAATAAMKEEADRWAGLGDIRNYRKQEVETDKLLISYEPPTSLTPEQARRLEESTTTLQEYSVIAWAMKSLQANTLLSDQNLADAVAFARVRDNDTVFLERHEAGARSGQTTISAIAAVLIRFGTTDGADCDWAWDVMQRIAAMKEPNDTFRHSKIPLHPANHLIIALVHDRRSMSPRGDSARKLFELTDHPISDVAQFAFTGLFMDSDEQVRWAAAHLAMDFSLQYRFQLTENGDPDYSTSRTERSRSLHRALERGNQTIDAPMTSVPPAWVEVRRQQRFGGSKDDAQWTDADPAFNAVYAAKIFPLFPIEAWCQSERYKPMVEKFLKELVAWTAERLTPSWVKDEQKWRSDLGDSSLIEWNRTLGDMLARAAPFFNTDFVRQELLAPFLTGSEKGLAILAEFADKTVLRQVFDARTIPTNTFDLLNDCVRRVIQDRVFSPNSYRAGQVHGFDMPRLIQALLFVNVEEDAPGAARFANGDWSQISVIMPLVTQLVTAIGWSPYVMQRFLTLCERAGAAYPVDEFAIQANAILDTLANTTAIWAGTLLPARTAATVQRLADANFPLRPDQAQQLLKVLDALIDLGDRRSAALEQAEAFRTVQSS